VEIPFIKIDDIAEGQPVVTTNIPGLAITKGIEEVTITASIPGLTSFPIDPASATFTLTEPGSQGRQVSDFLTLRIVEDTTTYVGQIFFQSDGANGFATNVAHLTNVIWSREETGGWQNLINFPIQLSVRSDLNTVPEPSTMLFLGAGLVGLVGFRKKLKK